MEVQTRPVVDLIPDPNNARKHDQKNLDAIKGSLAKFGQQKPIVIDKNSIVLAGNGTLAAAKALGWKDIQVVVSTLEGFNASAYALADNRSSELAEWDTEVLDATLKALMATEFNIAEIGFDIGDISLEAPDYSILEDGETGQDLDDMRGEVRKAIQIEFELEHYEEAQSLVKFWREQGAYVGMLLIEKLKSEKQKL